MKKFETLEEQREYLKNLGERLEEMRKVDPRTVDRSTLVDISTVKVRSDGTKYERILDYIEQIKNPYCYISNGTVVKISFADTDRTLEDCFENYITEMYYGKDSVAAKAYIQKHGLEPESSSQDK